MYDAIINQSFSYCFIKISSSICFCKLSMKLVKAISSSSSFFTSDHLNSISFSSLQGSVFCSVSSISIGSFSSSSFSSKLLLLYLIKILAIKDQLPKFYMEYMRHCVFALPQDQTILMLFPSTKLKYELFLTYS